MKYAFIGENKTEAFKGGKGICPNCNSELIAKCGDVNINHWAHKGTRNCDIWWENETEWHRNWKNNFPKEWQEIIHHDNTGEKHIADVKTKKDWVLEFQHSFIKPEERNSRNRFYSKLVWVIDGLRRKTDKKQFQKVLQESSQAPVGNVNIRKINFPEESRLLKEWMNCEAPVFFDFYELNQSILWFLLPLGIKDKAYLISFSRQEFIKVHNDNGFDDLIYKYIPNIRNIILEHKTRISNQNLNRIINNPRKRSFKNNRL
ncbi:competence protein CoiA [Labilibacter marinus]|uniref:competence protein CoiA n=1 Tax=Labilibacter marinus TaxID=1477105 RepID=UPI0009502249|nr:competence protein CoiA family protein [Labilibacter marinus]